MAGLQKKKKKMRNTVTGLTMHDKNTDRNAPLAFI